MSMEMIIVTQTQILFKKKISVFISGFVFVSKVSDGHSSVVKSCLKVFT